MGAALQQKPEIKIKLAVVKGPHAGQIFQLSKNNITMGRGPENNVVLMNDPQVSRVHAQIKVVNNEIEIVNLSQKNAVVVDGSSVQKWKLVNHSTFTLGDSEIQIEYDLGQVVVSVSNQKMGEVVSFKPAATPPPVAEPVVPAPKSEAVAIPSPPAGRVAKALKKKMSPPAVRSQEVAARPRSPQLNQQQMMRPMATAPSMMQNQALNTDLNAQFRAQQTTQEKNDSLMSSPIFKFVLIGLIILGVAYNFVSTPTKKSQAKKIASTLKYEDEINTRLYSKSEKDAEVKRDDLLKIKNSTQSLRVNENFIRGMRDYQSGNYLRAQEFFQLVLNLEPDHSLAKRHLYLSKVRFDEIVQEKLMLGDSYYKKHNFKMCASMYTQVLNMLDGKNTDPKFLLSEKKVRECDLARQGIR